MCTLSINKTSNDQLTALNEQRVIIEKKLKKLAFEANLENPGLLDALSNHMTRMPLDLRDIRKQDVGRHRVYYTGQHTQCSYKCIYVKGFKKTGVDDDDTESFQKKLITALSSLTKKVLEPGEEAQ